MAQSVLSLVASLSTSHLIDQSTWFSILKSILSIKSLLSLLFVIACVQPERAEITPQNKTTHSTARRYRTSLTSLIKTCNFNLPRPNTKRFVVKKSSPEGG